MVADFRFGRLPINESRFPLGESLATLIEDVLMPGRRLNGFWGAGKVLPKRLHDGELLLESHVF